MEQIFPINYFITIFSPTKVFKNRHLLKKWQMLLVVLLLNAMMLLPLSIQIGNLTAASLEDYVPNVLKSIDDELIEQFNSFVQEGQLVVTDQQETDHFVQNLESARTKIGTESSIIIASDGFIIVEKDKPVIEQTFLLQYPIRTVTTKAELVEQLSEHWFETNRIAIILTNFINIWLLLLVNFLGLLFGTGFILWLTRFGKIFTITRFNESVQLSLNAFGLPTIIAMIAGLIFQEPNSIALVQSSLYILWLLYVYWQTRFNDYYVEQKF